MVELAQRCRLLQLPSWPPLLVIRNGRGQLRGQPMLSPPPVAPGRFYKSLGFLQILRIEQSSPGSSGCIGCVHVPVASFVLVGGKAHLGRKGVAEVDGPQRFSQTDFQPHM